MDVQKINEVFLPEGVHVKNEVFDDDGNIILNNIMVDDTPLIWLSHKDLFLFLKKITKHYYDRKFIYNVLGEAYNLINNSKKADAAKVWPHIAPIIDFFKKNNIKHKLIFKTNNLSIKYDNINHIPTVFWIGKSKITVDINSKKFTKNFLLQIRGRNKSRENLFYWLKDSNLLNKFEYSFASSEPNHVDYKSLEDIPIRDSFELEQSKIKDYHNYTFCNIVMETYFEENYVFFTEKLDKALFAKQPFIIGGSCNFLETMKRIGFKTFDKWWDERYDKIENSDLRMESIKKLILDISSWSIEKCTDVYKEMLPIVEHNYNLANYIKNNHQYKDGGYSNMDYLLNKVNG